MNLRILWAVLALGLVGVASAQRTDRPHHIQFAEGRGILRNDHSQEARFAFAVKKVDDEQATGRFEFGTMTDHGRVTIFTDGIRELVVHENQANFAGPAVLRVTDLHGVAHDYHGHLHVHVVDNAVIFNGHERVHVDILELRWQSDDSNLVFEYGGRAHPDSIRVGVRTGD